MRICFLLLFSLASLFQSVAQTGQDTHNDMPAGTVEPSIPDSMLVYNFCEQMPAFPSGDSTFVKFIQKNIIYPQGLENAVISGSVVINFIVEKDGSLSDIKIRFRKDVPLSLDQAIIDAALKSPRWNPGKQNGKPVRVYKAVRIPFNHIK